MRNCKEINVGRSSIKNSKAVQQGGIGSRKGRAPTIVGRTAGCTALEF